MLFCLAALIFRHRQNFSPLPHVPPLFDIAELVLWNNIYIYVIHTQHQASPRPFFMLYPLLVKQEIYSCDAVPSEPKHTAHKLRQAANALEELAAFYEQAEPETVFFGGQ